MDWQIIEKSLLNSVWGVILLGALGSFLFWGILNLVGRANKGVKNLWIFYREGREKLFFKLKENDLRFEYFKYTSSRFRIHFVTIPVLMVLNYVIAIFLDLFNKQEAFLFEAKDTFIEYTNMFLTIIFGLTALINMFNDSMIKRVYKAKIGEQTENEEDY
ncbi:hypothetical protein DZC72_13590 [Maribacter algicola]|uniref:Uncharacterized protein n=1 Tax=Maribacter algicola TaxID=2498892 RepID=A0A426RI77_9FLAO|nr:hypothetical protein [Maribacter algicola]RRQ48707.1 hypothetical protein DZC72_13590 [Maribacter algicola]